MNKEKYLRRIVGVCILMLLPMFVWAQTDTKTSFYPYFGFLDYSKAQGISGAGFMGLYGYYGYGDNHSFEGDFSYIRMKYDYSGESYKFNLNQADLTFTYNNYALDNWKIRSGIHGILSQDDLTDKAYVVYAGLSRYKTYSYEFGIDVYNSIYGNYTPDSVRATQVTVTGGFNFGDFYKSGSFFARTRGHYISLSEDIGFGKKSYNSIEQSLSYYKGSWTLEVHAWVGAQVFGVQNDGFIVKNLSEKHKGEFGGSMKYAFNDNWTFKFDASYGLFQELEQEWITLTEEEASQSQEGRFRWRGGTGGTVPSQGGTTTYLLLGTSPSSGTSRSQKYMFMFGYTY